MNMKKDPESIRAMICDGYLSTHEKEEINKYTQDRKAFVCYEANLKGSIATVLAGTKKALKGYVFYLSKYRFHRIAYTISGQATVLINKKTYLADSGSVYYFAPGETGKVINKANLPWRHIYIHFTGYEASKLCNEADLLSERVFHVSRPGKIQRIFEDILDTCEEHPQNSQIICDHYLRILLFQLKNQVLHNQAQHSISRQRYLECINYIKDNFSNILSLQDIAEKCHIDKIYMCRLFKKYGKTTPMAYVMNLKMNKAALLLIHTDNSIKQISLILNFENQYYFSKAFKKTFGISPKFYRKSH